MSCRGGLPVRCQSAKAAKARGHQRAVAWQGATRHAAPTSAGPAPARTRHNRHSCGTEAPMKSIPSCPVQARPAGAASHHLFGWLAGWRLQATHTAPHRVWDKHVNLARLGWAAPGCRLGPPTAAEVTSPRAAGEAVQRLALSSTRSPRAGQAASSEARSTGGTSLRLSAPNERSGEPGGPSDPQAALAPRPSFGSATATSPRHNVPYWSVDGRTVPPPFPGTPRQHC